MTEPGKDLDSNERLRRWRLLLGEAAGESMRGLGLSSDDQAIDKCLGQLYDDGGEWGTSKTRRGGLGRSAPVAVLYPDRGTTLNKDNPLVNR